MTHGMKPDLDDRPRHDHTAAAGAAALDHDALLDHHIEELLGALSDLDLLRLHGAVEPD